MKIRFLIGIVAFFLLATQFAHTQDQDVPITVLVYMDADDAAEYVSMEQDIWKPIHAQRVRDGKLLSWQLYQVISPSRDGHDYNFLIVETYPNWASMENPYGNMEKLFQEVHGGADLEAMWERTENAREMEGQEWWVRQDWVAKDGSSVADVKYLVVDWMDVTPGHWADYEAMEKEYYKPVHQSRVANGNILSWGLWGKMGYSEVEGSIDAATSAAYASFQDMWDSYPENAWEDAHGDADQEMIYEKMRKYRAMTGSTMYRLVDYVIPE
jgi:hypothetical protein